MCLTLTSIVYREKNLHLERENAASTPSALAKLLKLSPNSKGEVESTAAKGVMRSSNSATPDPDKRNRFLERVGKCYTPIVEEICSRPKFQGKSRPKRVLEQVLRRLSNKRKAIAVATGNPASKRQLVFATTPNSTPVPTLKPTPVPTPMSKPTTTSSASVIVEDISEPPPPLADPDAPWLQTQFQSPKPPPVQTPNCTPAQTPKPPPVQTPNCTTTPTPQPKPAQTPTYRTPKLETHVHDFLSDMAASWKQARRNHDREAAARILQITLKGIPKGTGRVSDWLGPMYFNDVRPVQSGCRVRVLKTSDNAKFRNDFANTTLGKLSLTVALDLARTLTLTLTHTVNAIVGAAGSSQTQITVRENWGMRVVVQGEDGKEQILWAKHARCCNTNPHSVQDPYDAYAHNKWNRAALRKVTVGTVVRHLRKAQSVPPTGCAPDNSTSVWETSIVVRVIRSGSHQYVNYSVAAERCIHHQSVRLSKRMISRARRDNRLWGSGCRSSATCTERHVVSPTAYNHLRDWIYSTDFLEPLKATEQATQRGHCFAVREAASATFTRYKASAQAANCEGVSERVYNRVLGQKIFTKLRKDHCMCATCLRSGWRGIWDNGRKLLKKLDACTTWETSTDSEGTQTRHVPGNHLKPRLKRLWDFIRLQLHLHVEPSSEIGGHCLKLKLGSLAEPRSNDCCNHGDFAPPPPDEEECSERCCADGCAKRTKYHCRHCSTSFCKEHLRDSICTAEHLPKDCNVQFVCPECSPRVEAQTHKEGGCATCDEVHYFKLDVMKVARSTGVADIIGRGENLCKSIDLMVAHSARMVNQVTLPNPNPVCMLMMGRVVVVVITCLAAC